MAQPLRQKMILPDYSMPIQEFPHLPSEPDYLVQAQKLSSNTKFQTEMSRERLSLPFDQEVPSSPNAIKKGVKVLFPRKNKMRTVNMTDMFYLDSNQSLTSRRRE